jgi:hypothetical protein
MIMPGRLPERLRGVCQGVCSVRSRFQVPSLPRTSEHGRGTSTITLELKEDGTLRGHSFSNSYHGEYRLGSDNVFTVVDHRILTTLVGEPEGSRYDEYLMFLSQAARYEFRDGRLSILCDGRMRLHFSARGED